MARFCALYSGSSGNCVYIESGGDAILIDAGVSLKAIRAALCAIGSDIEKIRAVFITHEHSDHIRGLPVLARKYPVSIYANAGTIAGIAADSRNPAPDRLTELPTGGSVELGALQITSFATSHDSRESVGYRIHTENGRRIAVATDLGFVSAEVAAALCECELVMLESNHDTGMLKNGRYPYYLKRRILSNRGHLSNESCAAVLPSLIGSGSKFFVLGHLSQDNNLPELALATSVCALDEAGAKLGDDYSIEAAPRTGPGRLYEL